MPTLFELKRDMADKLKAGKALVETAIKENRALSEEETTRVDAIDAEAREIGRKISTFEMLDRFESRGGAGGPDLPDLDNARQPYSLVRALRMALDVREGKAKWSGLEYEVHQELAKTSERSPQGVLVPWNLRSTSMAAQAASHERRDVTTSTASGGIANILGTELIDLLRNRMVMKEMGARIMTGLTGGTFALPKLTSSSTAYHVSEATAATSSNAVLGSVTWTPRTLSANVAISRKALLQASPDVEAVTRDDLMKVIALEFDRVGVNGSGADQIPLGVLQDPNVPTTAIGANGGAPTWAMVVALETAVATANADFGRMGYLTSNAGRGIMKQTPKIGSTFPVFLWDSNEINGYHAMASNQVPANLVKGSGTSLTSLIFGNFESATYGLWSGLDLLIDPYSNSRSGNITISVFQDYDFQFRYEQSFAKCVDMTTS